MFQTSYPKAVVFDFDGLLVDTEWAIYQSWLRIFDNEGHPLPLNVFIQCVGSGYTHWNPADYLEQLTGKTYDWDSINNYRQQEIHADLANSGLLPGAKELITYLSERGIPLAVASSSSHKWVDSWLDKLKIHPYFSTVVCRDDGHPVKPDPSLYLAASAQLNIPPQDCLAIEDSGNGTMAAHRAGMTVFSVPNKITKLSDFKLSNGIFEDLCQILCKLKTIEPSQPW